MELSTERLARNQALFREVNERVNEVCSATVSFETEFMAESDPRSSARGYPT